MLSAVAAPIWEERHEQPNTNSSNYLRTRLPAVAYDRATARELTRTSYITELAVARVQVEVVESAVSR